MCFGPIAGIMGRMGGVDVRRPGRPGARQARRRGRHQHRRRPAARPGRHRRAGAAERRRLRRRAWTAPPTRCGCSSRCARPPPSGCSRTSRGCASSCRTPSTPTPAASPSTARPSSAASPRRCPAAGRAGLDPSDPESIQRLLGSGVLEPEETPEQQMALRRLETLLALVEGWVDTVVAAAAKDRLPGHSALAETMRRRRASGGPAEQTFATLVGPGAAAAPAARRRHRVGARWPSSTAAPTATGCGPPGPAADVGRPGRAAGLRRPPGARRRAADADRDDAERRRARTDRRTPEDRRTPVDEACGPGSVDEVGGPVGRRCRRCWPAPRPRGSRAPARRAGSARPAPRSARRGRARAGAPARAPARSRRRTRASPAAGWTAGCCGRPGCRSPTGGCWLSTQRTLAGSASPSRCAADSARARAISSSSPPRERRRRSSRVCSLATICATQRRSSAGLNAAGMSTTVRPLSR